jgi:outer membrane protein TolC
MRHSHFFIIILLVFSAQNALAEPQTLKFEDFWQQVKQAHPALKEKDALSAPISSTPALEIPAPEISISQMNENTPFSSTGKMQRTVELSQTIPFPTKFSKATEIKKTNILKSNNETKILEKEIRVEAFEAYLNYAKNTELKKILGDKITYYQSHSSKARAIQVTNQAYQVHLYDIGIELSSLKSEMKLIDIELAENEATLNRLRNNSDDGKFFPDLETARPASQIIAPDSSIQSHPQLALNQTEIESMKREKEMAGLDWAPDFNLKLKSIKSFDPHYTDGKELMVGITLPFLFPWQRSGKSESLGYKIRAEEYKGEQIKNVLTQDLKNLSNKVKEQWELLTIYRDQTLPLVQKKLDRAHKLTTLDMESLEAHKNAIDQFFGLRSKILEEEMNYRMSIFKYEELLSKEK